MVEAGVHAVYNVERQRGDIPRVETVVVLKARNEERYLPIWIGFPEAITIARYLHASEIECRPGTPELIAQLIELFGGRLESVHVTALHGQIYCTTLRLIINGRVEEVDC